MWFITKQWITQIVSVFEPLEEWNNLEKYQKFTEKNSEYKNQDKESQSSNYNQLDMLWNVVKILLQYLAF